MARAGRPPAVTGAPPGSRCGTAAGEIGARRIRALGDDARRSPRKAPRAYAASALISAYRGCRCARVPRITARRAPRTSACARARWPSLTCASRTPAGTCALRGGRGGAHHRGERARQVLRHGVGGDREQVLEAARIQEGDLARRATAALRMRCASSGISWRRFEPTTSTPSSDSTSAIFRPRFGNAPSAPASRESSWRSR